MATPNNKRTRRQSRGPTKGMLADSKEILLLHRPRRNGGAARRNYPRLRNRTFHDMNKASTASWKLGPGYFSALLWWQTYGREKEILEAGVLKAHEIKAMRGPADGMFDNGLLTLPTTIPWAKWNPKAPFAPPKLDHMVLLAHSLKLPIADLFPPNINVEDSQQHTHVVRIPHPYLNDRKRLYARLKTNLGAMISYCGMPAEELAEHTGLELPLIRKFTNKEKQDKQSPIPNPYAFWSVCVIAELPFGGLVEGMECPAKDLDRLDKLRKAEAMAAHKMYRQFVPVEQQAKVWAGLRKEPPPKHKYTKRHPKWFK